MYVPYQYLVLQYNGTASLRLVGGLSYTYGSVVSTSTAVLQYTPDSQWVDFTERLYIYCTGVVLVQ